MAPVATQSTPAVGATISADQFNAMAGGNSAPAPAVGSTISAAQFQAMSGGTPAKVVSTSPFNPDTPNSKFVQPGSAEPGTTTASKFVGSLGKAALDTGKKIVTNTKGQLDDSVNNITASLRQAPTDATQATEPGTSAFSKIKGFAKLGIDTTLRPAASLIQAVISPVTGTLQTAAQGAGGLSAEALGVKGGNVINKAVGAFNATPGGQKVRGAIQKTQTYLQAHPEVGNTVNAAAIVAGAVAGGADLPLEDIPGQMVDQLKPVQDAYTAAVPKVTVAANSVAEQARAGFQDYEKTQLARSQANSEAAETKNNDLTNKIIQGTQDDIAPARESLQNIDASQIKNKTDLSQQLENNAQTIKDKLDEGLASDTSNHKLSEFDSTIKNSDGTTKVTNPVQDAIDQLKTQYQKIKLPGAEAKINALEEKANTTGLTVKELNDLATEHGQTFKAFNTNLNGEYANGLGKQAARNTYFALKDEARGLFNDPAFKAADTAISHDLNTKDLIDEQIEKDSKANAKQPEKTTFGKIKSGLSKVNLGNVGLKPIMDLLPDGEMDVKDLLTKLQSKTGSSSARDNIISNLEDAITKNQNKPSVLSESERNPNGLASSGGKGVGTNELPKGQGTYDIKANRNTTFGTKLPPGTRLFSQFEKMFSPDDITQANKILEQMQNRGKTIDLKAINQVVKRITSVEDVKPITKTMANVQEVARLNRIQKIPVRGAFSAK